MQDQITTPTIAPSTTEMRESLDDYLKTRRDFEVLTTYSTTKLKERMVEAERISDLLEIHAHNFDPIYINIVQKDPLLIRAELARRAAVNGTQEATSPAGDTDPIGETLQVSGIDQLQTGAKLSTIEEAVRNLAHLIETEDAIRQATVREAALKKLQEIGIGAPGRLLDAAMPKAARDGDDGLQGKPLLLRDIEPHPQPVDGARMLVEICRGVRRYVVADYADIVAMVLWCVQAHAIDAFAIAPFLNLSSPEKGCGKSTTLTVITHLLPRPLLSGSVSPASIFRAIERYKPTFLIDEADAFESLAEELRGLLNASHLRASSQVIRTVGDDHEPRAFSTWCPKAIALIGRLPDTLNDRSIVINMRRRKRGELCERFSAIDPHPELDEFGQKIARWTQDNFDALRRARPEAEGIDLRLYDNWAPLLSVADVAGGRWPEWARIAASRFVVKASDTTSIRVELLADAAEAMKDRDRISSEQLIAGLNDMADRPWPTFSHGKPITQIAVSRILKNFEIKPSNIRFQDGVAKGYHKSDLVAALSRYVTPENPLQPLQENFANKLKELEAIFVADQTATKEELGLIDPLHADLANPVLEWEAVR